MTAQKTPPKAPRAAITWQAISRAAGLVIIFALLIGYLISEMTHHHLDTPIALSFLGIGSALVGLPEGLTIMRTGGDYRIGPTQKNGDAP